MKRKKIESQTENTILTGMILSKTFLTRLSSVLKFELFKSEVHKIVAKWCIRYYNTYQDAPGTQIESIFHAWVESKKPKPELVTAVEDFLGHLSDKHETDKDLNIQYLLDEAAVWVSGRKLEILKDTLEYNLLKGNVEAAKTAVISFESSTVGESNGIDVLADKAAWEMTYSQIQEPLINFRSKAAKKFLSYDFVRDSLVGIMGPEKRGKTWWCIEFAILGIQNRKKVAFFEVGDMSQAQIMRRLGTYFTGRPSRRDNCGEIQIPVNIQKVDKSAHVDYDTIRVEHPISLESSLRAIANFKEVYGVGENHFRLSIHPNGSVNTSDILGILQGWEYEHGFVPDIIIIDYPDIMAPELGTQNAQSRDQINATWKALRRISQEKHCLVLVPTQANAAGHQTETLDTGNFSEDKRKFAHVTGMLGLNQTAEEKEMGVMRLNWILNRENIFSPNQCLYVAQCLALGRPMVRTCM